MTVYFLQAGDAGPIKIGYTAAIVEYRITQIQIGCPWKIRIIGSVDGSAVNERWLHRNLSAYRMHGEWFEPHPVVMAKVDEVTAFGFVWPDVRLPQIYLGQPAARSRSRYPFDRMKPGESFAYPSSTSESVARSLACRAGKRRNWQFRIRKTETGLRCWRIE